MSQRRQLFLSYAHDDNRTAEEKQIGWVSYFRRALEAELGELASIWLDKREIEPDAFFDKSIETALQASDELITVLSRRWLERPYCLKEFSLFLTFKGQEGSRYVHKVLIVLTNWKTRAAGHA